MSTTNEHPSFQSTIFDPQENPSLVDNLLKYAIAPRPICFASTVDKDGRVNLSPFSYFNFMSQQPPICVFSPLLRMRDGSSKHTLDNIREVPEVVINIVNYSMVQQQSLASTEYPKEVNEFTKSGFHPIPSLLVKPPRVAESPMQIECRVRDIIALDTGPGAGNLVIAEVLRVHVHSHLLDENQRIDQAALDLVARLGGDWYCRVQAQNLFEVPKPLRTLGIGIDQLPEQIRLSPHLTGNQLGLLANVEQLPVAEPSQMPEEWRIRLQHWKGSQEELLTEQHQLAATFLDQGDVQRAWQILLHHPYINND
jgi:flavin reductase (DIM6/NTAB) family NADH-FMN oxidoreductase RutF